MYKEIKTFYEAITWSSLWIVGQGVSRQENTMAKLGLPLKDLLHLYILFSEWKPLGDTLGNDSFHPFHVCRSYEKTEPPPVPGSQFVGTGRWHAFEENERTRTSLRSTFSGLSHQAGSLEQAMKRQYKIQYNAVSSTYIWMGRYNHSLRTVTIIEMPWKLSRCHFPSV